MKLHLFRPTPFYSYHYPWLLSLEINVTDVMDLLFKDIIVSALSCLTTDRSEENDSPRSICIGEFLQSEIPLSAIQTNSLILIVFLLIWREVVLMSSNYEFLILSLELFGSKPNHQYCRKEDKNKNVNYS